MPVESRKRDDVAVRLSEVKSLDGAGRSVRGRERIIRKEAK